MSYYYRNPQQEDQQKRGEASAYHQGQGAEDHRPARSKSGCWTGIIVVLVLALVVLGVVVLFMVHTANQLEEEISTNHPRIESLLDQHDMSMLDLMLLGRELEGASQEELIQRAQEMGISEEELRDLANDAEIRELIDQFLGR
jgi:flagellar basal body-associated protein FliL